MNQNASLLYYIQQKSLQKQSSFQQAIIILLMGLNVLKLEVKWQAHSDLFVCPYRGGEVDMCAPRPGPLSFLFSYQRPRTYQFQISQEQRETETTDRKGIFFPPFFSSSSARLTECLHPSHFTEESNYSSELRLAQQRQRPTWQHSVINQLNLNF